jgi:transposase
MFPAVGPKGRLAAAFHWAGWKSWPRIPDHRFHHCAGAPTCSRHQKGEGEDEAIGRSRGGLSTKINIAVDALGNPVRLILTAGQVADICQAEGLIEGFSFENLLADKGYDADNFRASIADAGAQAVIPSKRSRSQAIPHKDLYKERNLVERFINKIKHYRRVATRYEKTAVSFAAVLFLVATMIWLKWMSTRPRSFWTSLDFPVVLRSCSK